MTDHRTDSCLEAPGEHPGGRGASRPAHYHGVLAVLMLATPAMPDAVPPLADALERYVAAVTAVLAAWEEGARPEIDPAWAELVLAHVYFTQPRS